jgi:tungstate transport system ATP-binding protein
MFPSPFYEKEPDMTTPLYNIRSLEKSYGGKPALSIDRLTLKPSSITGLIGPNGSGKSTLLRLLGLIEKPDQGEILFNGNPVGPFSEEARFVISMLPQEPFLMKRSVFNNVAYGLKLRGKSVELENRVCQALALVGLDGKDFMKRPWHALSVGETQRVALAARLALEPKVLLLDEPTASVDAASAELIRQASLKARHEWGAALVIASHDWQWLYDVCDEIFHLFRGRIFGSGRETLVLGHWRELGGGLWGKPLSDDQHLIVPKPPFQDAAAVIADAFVTNGESRPKADHVILRSDVLRLSLERNTGQVFAAVVAGGQTFSVKLTEEQIHLQSVFPGKTVFLHYRPSRIVWI